MMTTPRQDRLFIEHIVSDTVLEKAIEWIGSNIEPEDVFDDSTLEIWADNNGYVLED